MEGWREGRKERRKGDRMDEGGEKRPPKGIEVGVAVVWAGAVPLAADVIMRARSVGGASLVPGPMGIGRVETNMCVFVFVCVLRACGCSKSRCKFPNALLGCVGINWLRSGTFSFGTCVLQYYRDQVHT